MAGIGDSWGTREELLHPRDSKGRFRSKWKMSESVLNAVLAVTQNFSPRTFASDSQATQYTQNLAHLKPNRFQGGKGYPRLQADFENANNDLLDGIPDEPSTKKFVKMMDDSMIDAPDSFIASSVVGADAFGLTPETLPQLEEMTGNVIANRGYTAVNLGTPLGGGQGQITMSIATPKGTKIAAPGRNPSDRAIYMDRDQEFTVTKVKPDGRGGYYMWAVATPKTPGENPGPEGGHAGAGHANDREGDIKALGDTQASREMGEQGASQLPGGEAAGGKPEDQQGRVINAPADDPATARARSRAAILGRPAAAPESQPQSPAAPPAGAGSTPQANVPEAVTPAPSGVDVPSGATSTATGEAQASFRDKINDAKLESPSKAARKDFNDAIAGVESGKRNPADIVRDLDSDVADLKRQQGQEGSDREQLGQDAGKLTKLADVIAEHFNTPGSENRDSRVQSAEKPATRAPSDAPARGPKKQVSAGDRSKFEERMDARLATRAPAAKKAAAPERGPSPVEIRAEKQKALLNDTGARPTAKKKIDPKKIGVAAPTGNQLDRDLEDDRLNAEQRTQWSDELGPEPAVLKKQAGNILLDEVADLLRNGRITKPKAAARLRDQAREDDDAGADYLRRAADLIEADTSKANKRVPTKPKRGIVPDEAEATLAGRTERNILTGLNQLDVGNLRGLADRWGIETRGDDKKLKTKAVLAKELAAHWKATPSLQTKAPDAAPVDELDELLLPALKERAKADGIKLNSKMRKAEILAALKAKRDGSETEAAPEAVPEVPTAAKKVAKKAAAKKPTEAELVDFLANLPPVPTGPEAEVAVLNRPALSEADFREGLQANSLRQLREMTGPDGANLGLPAKASKKQMIDALSPSLAAESATAREKRLSEAPKTPEAKDLAAVANAPEVPKPISKAAAKAVKTADVIAEVKGDDSGLYHPDVATDDLKTMDDLSTEDRIAVALLERMGPENRGKILVQMPPEDARRVMRAEEIINGTTVSELSDLGPEDRIAVDLLKRTQRFPGMREAVLKDMAREHRERVLSAEKMINAEGGAPVPAKKAAKKVTPKAVAEVAQEVKEQVATTKGPKGLSSEDRVAARLIERIGEIDPSMRERVLADMPEKERGQVLDAEHRVKLQRTQVKKGGGDLDQILSDRGIKEPATLDPERIAFDRAHEAVAKGFPDQAVKGLRREQAEAKQEKDLARRSAVDPALSPGARETSSRRSERAAQREAWAGNAAEAIQAAPEIEKKPGSIVKKAVEDVVISLPESEKASWDSATVDGLREAAARGGITLPDGVTTKEQALQEVIKELARRKLAGEELPNFDAPEAPRAPEPTLPKASTNIKGDTVDGFKYREAVRQLESGDMTPAQAADEMKAASRAYTARSMAIRPGDGTLSPEARAVERDRNLDVARQYEAAAKELRARKRVPKPSVVNEVLQEAAAEAVPKAPMAEALRNAESTEEANRILSQLGRLKKPYLDLAAQLGLPERKSSGIAQLKKDILTVTSGRRIDDAMGRAINAPARSTAEPGSDAELINFMNTTGDLAEARERLAGMKLQELKDFARLAKVHHAANANKASIQSTLVQQLVQRRLTSDAISKPMRPREAGESIADWAKRATPATETAPASVSEVLARGRGSTAPEATSTTSPMSAFANPGLVEAMRQTQATTPAPAKKVAKKAAAAAAEDATVRGLQRMAEGGFREEAPTPPPVKKVAKKAAPSVEAQVETRMDVKAAKAAAPAAPTGDVPESAGGFTHAELMELGPARLKEMEDDLGITRRTLNRSERVDDILQALAAQPPKADGGGRSYAARQAEVTKLSSQKPTDKRRLGGGTSTTSLLTYDDGRMLIHKDQRRNFDDPKELTDADTVASQVLDAITGGNAAAVHRVDENELYMEHIDGTLGQDALTRLEGGLRRADLGKLMDSTQGRLMGLSDALMLNSDRTPSNWILRDDGTVTGIDHGFAFAFNSSNADLWPASASVNPWAKFLTNKSGTPVEWADNPFTPADMEKIHARIVALEPEFQKLGRQEWFNGMMKRFRDIQDHAKGTEDLL
jgi:transposase